MKKIFFIVMIFINLSLTVSADSWCFKWDEETTTVDVPLGTNLSSYVNKPKAYLYRNGIRLDDAKINYITTGDWLYLLTDVDTNKVGNYQVWYKAVETKYKPGQCQGYKTLVTFKVYDDKPPMIKEIPERISYRVGANKPDYRDLIIAEDNSGNCSINIDDNLVNYDLPGEYELIVHISDGSNIVKKIIIIEVIDPEGPIITFLGENNVIEIGLGEKVSISNYFSAFDKIDGDVTSSISYEKFETGEEREFPLTVYFYDKNGNESTIVVSIKIIDKSFPIIELCSNSLILNYLDDYQSYIKNNIKRAYLGDKDILELIDINFHNIDNSVGSYVVTYSYNYGGKFASVECEIKLLSDVPPTILVENIMTPIGIRPNILEYIEVHDDSDPLIASKVEIDESLVDYSLPGIYPVTISVVNSSALSANKTLYITVLEEERKIERGIDYKIIIIGGIIVLVGVVFLFYKKKRG